MNTNFKSRILPMAVMASIAASYSPVTRGEGDENFTKEQLDSAVSDAVTAAMADATSKHDKDINGLKSKNAELLTTLGTATEKLKGIEGVDIDGLLALKETVESDEILKLASEGKHSEAIEKATEKIRVTHSAELDTMTTKIEELQNSNIKNSNLVDKLLIDGGSQSAFVKAKGIETAIDDIALRARSVFKVEDGELVARDADGEMIKGEKGPLTMPEWIESLKETAPHLFPASETVGVKGGKGTKVDMTTIDAQIVQAAEDNNFDLMRELKKKKKEGQR